MKNRTSKVLATFLSAFVVLFTVTSVSAQFCTFTTQDVACNGEATGIITFAPTGGVAPYDYMWSHNGVINTNEVFNLPAAMYTITVSDAAGASEICTVEITQPTPITITNVIETDPMCGLMDGSFVIEAIPQSGGALSDLMYSIDGGATFQTSNTFTGLGPDDYLIIVADNNGCYIVDSRQLVDAETVIINLESAMCDPGGTISIDITASGGTLPYTYAWSDGSSAEDLTGAAPGAYSVTVTDREGCASVGNYSVTDCCDASMFCDYNLVPVTCNGGADGSIDVAPIGGTAPYTFAWSHDAGLISNVASMLPAGFYNVTITDALDCESICGIDVTEPIAIVINSIDTADPTCGGADGSLTVNATPSSATGILSELEYSSDGGANFQTSNVLTNLAAGTYNVVVRDINGCTATQTATLQNAAGLNINLLDLSCVAGNMINISVMGSGGVPPLNYTWTGTAGFTNPSPTELSGPPGTYTVVVTDDNGCTAEASYTQDNCCDSGMFCTSTVENTSCNGGTNGTINISPVGGTAPYTYTWSHDAGNTGSDAVDLMAGFYSVTVVDAGGCSAVCGIDVEEPTAIVIDDITSQDPMCGLNDGAMLITATPKSGSGCSDLEYSIDGGMNFQASNQFTDLGAGDYLVIVRDCDDCFSVQSAQLLDGAGVNISFTTDCSNNVVDIDVTGMGGTTPYTYEWEGPNGFVSTDEDVVNGETGTYYVTLTDASGCQDFATIIQDMCCALEAFCPADLMNVACSAFPAMPTEFLNSDPDGGADAAAFVAMGGIITAFPAPCSDITITATDNTTGTGCTNDPMVVERNFVITDGVTIVECSMTMSGEDTAPPTIDLEAADVVLSCPADVNQDLADWLANNGGAMASDDCGSIVWTHDYVGGVAVIGDSYTVIFTATDNCGNTAQTTATFSSIDSCCMLVATCPANVMDVGCGDFSEIPPEFLNADSDGGADVALFIAMGGTISDTPGACGDIIITAADVETGGGCINDPIVLIRTFTLTDGVTTVECGTMMTGGDASLPSIDVDAMDAVVDCPDDLQLSFAEWLANNAGAVATDDCGDVIWTNDYAGGTIEFGVVYTITFTAADECGNEAYTIANYTANACPEGGNIDGEVWEDSNGNGTQDGGEPFLATVPVSLFTANGVLVSTQFTDGAGYYLFEDVPHGDYIIHFGTDIEYSFTLPNVGSDTSDSDVDHGNGFGTTSIINHTGGDRNFDAGVHICVPVGELVWFDSNMNDQWDPSENGINGMQVKVYKQGLSAGFYEYDYTHTGPKPGTPSDDGYYKFCLPPGTYYLEFLIPPFGLVPVVPGVGGSNNDSDVTGNNGSNTTSTFSILSGEEKCDIGAGYYPMATIGNGVFFDGNSNGLADPGEAGMANVTVELYDATTGTMLESKVTDAQGSYLFDYLGKDDYYIKVVPPTNYLVTTANVGTDEEMDSDVDNSNGPNTTAMYSLTPGMELANVDVGLVEGTVVAVDWVSISGENRGDYNQIDWTVAFQNSTDHFEVERRIDDEASYTSIAKKEPTSSIAQQSYDYQDFDIKAGSVMYYRIVEYDYNGNASYSDVIAINTDRVRTPSISLAPNPFVNELTIEIDTPTNANATISFWDASGRSIELPGFTKGQLDAGMNRITYDWTSVPPGVYSARISLDGNQFFKKLIKVE